MQNKERIIWIGIIIGLLVIFAIIWTYSTAKINAENEYLNTMYLKKRMQLTCFEPNVWDSSMWYQDKECMERWR